MITEVKNDHGSKKYKKNLTDKKIKFKFSLSKLNFLIQN